MGEHTGPNPQPIKDQRNIMVETKANSTSVSFISYPAGHVQPLKKKQRYGFQCLHNGKTRGISTHCPAEYIPTLGETVK